MGSVRRRKWKGRHVFYTDYIAANGEPIRQIIGPGEEGRRLIRRILAARGRGTARDASAPGFANDAHRCGRGVKTLHVMLGHASSQISLDRYTHLMPTALEDATARLNAFIQGKLKATVTTGAREESAKPAS